MNDFETRHLRQWLRRAFRPEEWEAVEAEISGYMDTLEHEDRACMLDRSWREILDAARNAYGTREIEMAMFGALPSEVED